MSAWKRDCGQTGSTHPHMFWCLVYTHALSHQNVKKNNKKNKKTTTLCPPPHKHHVKIPNCMINHGWARRLDNMKSFLKQQLIFAIDADANAALSGLKMMHSGDLSKWWSWRKMLFCLSRSWQVSILRLGFFFVCFFLIDQGPLLGICGNRGGTGGKEAYLKWQEMGQTEHTQRETYKLASAEDSDVPSQNERPRQLAWTSRPSSAVCQAKLNLWGGWGGRHCSNCSVVTFSLFRFN